MKDTFLGTVYARPNKTHTCHTCGAEIKPFRLPSWEKQKIRHDVWKTWKTVVNKYFCKECEHLLDTQVSLQTNDKKPYNPEKREFIVRFPQLFQEYFKTYYPDIRERIEVIFDLQMIFGIWKSAKIQYFFAKRIFRLKKFNGFYYRFDHDDYKKFKKTYNQTKNQAYILLDK